MKRPNILILYTDQQRWDAVGINGNPDIQTPNLDRLARQGVNFDRFFVQNPVCMPSRLSFLTGQYPSTLKITHMGVPVPPETVTLPHLLKPYGYVTANIGKLHFLPHACRDHRDPHPDYGFDHLEISDEPGQYEDAYRAWVRQRAPDQLDRVSLGESPAYQEWKRVMSFEDPVVHPEERFPKHPVPFPSRSELTHTAFVAEQTAEFLTRHSDHPFLCIAGFYSPHSPWVAPQEFIDQYDPQRLQLPTFPPEIDARRSVEHFSDSELCLARQGYYAMVSEVDHHVGRLLDRLDELGLAEDTIVLFTSDHGEWLGEHLRYGKGYPGHDCVTRVPCIIRWPASTAAPGRTCSGLAEAVDVLPSLLEAAGVQIPRPLQGHSLLPVLREEEDSVRRSALTEMRGWKNLRTPNFRYVVEQRGRESLYDLESDPDAYRDVAADPAHAADLAEARRELIAHLLDSERPLPRIWPY